MTEGGTPAAVVFDVDGLLVDTEPLWRDVERRVFAEVGVELTEEDCVQTVGLRIDEVVRFWFERRPWNGVGLADVQARIVDGMANAIVSHGSPMPGARQAIETAQRLAVPLAVASSSPRSLIAASLRRLGVVGCFAAIASAQDVPDGKPDPAVYLRATRILDVDPRRCVAVEDSLNGVKAAQAAGMRCIAVPMPEQQEAVASLADLTLGSLTDLTPEHLAVTPP